MADDEDHALAPFLTTRLPQLGLDFETYGPYVLPLLTDTEADEDEWTSVLELLQASSESHSDDEQAWIELRKDIEVAWKQHRSDVEALEKKELAQHHQELKEKLEKERELAKEAAVALEEEKKREAESNRDNDETKSALIARYAYEADDDNDEETEAPVSNREVAAQVGKEQAQELRKQSVTSKKDERTKTAKAKLEKAQLKEERRKRATKGERKR